MTSRVVLRLVVLFLAPPAALLLLLDAYITPTWIECVRDLVLAGIVVAHWAGRAAPAAPQTQERGQC